MVPSRGRGIIYVQVKQKRTVSEEEMVNALYDECVEFADRVSRGEAPVSNHTVEIIPPDPLPVV